MRGVQPNKLKAEMPKGFPEWRTLECRIQLIKMPNWVSVNGGSLECWLLECWINKAWGPVCRS